MEGVNALADNKETVAIVEGTAAMVSDVEKEDDAEDAVIRATGVVVIDNAAAAFSAGIMDAKNVVDGETDVTVTGNAAAATSAAEEDTAAVAIMATIPISSRMLDSLYQVFALHHHLLICRFSLI